MQCRAVYVLAAVTATTCSAQQDGVPLVDFPHPLITEVLFDVPDNGDATLDGSRDASGDEFVEVTNPHDKRIRLRGYTLSDRNLGGRGAFEFSFPDFWLNPGQTAVVFNGLNQSISGPVGTSARGPSGTNPRFEDGFVFSLQNKSSAVGLANGGDWVLLKDPRDNPIQCLHWGSISKPLPDGPDLFLEKAPNAPRGSVSRETTDGPLIAHTLLDGRPFSPGGFEPKPEAGQDDEGEPANTNDGGDGGNEDDGGGS